MNGLIALAGVIIAIFILVFASPEHYLEEPEDDEIHGI